MVGFVGWLAVSGSFGQWKSRVSLRAISGLWFMTSALEGGETAGSNMRSVRDLKTTADTHY
jgi:hypothetical protein